MNTTAQFISNSKTGAFSKIVTDYISGNELLQPFYKYPVSFEGIKGAIENRKLFKTDRNLLVQELQKQYLGLETNKKIKENIRSLLGENTFTICTAHQPNIFTGYLYFIYKILHAIKLAEELAGKFPENNFVPVFYMGSEDADLHELGHIYLFGEKYEWKTAQTGAVGRMKVDKALIKLIDGISGQLLVYPFGKAVILLLKDCYKEGTTIELACFKLINTLFSEYGLIVLLPDNAGLKRAFIPVIEKELEEQFSHKAVTETVADFPVKYKVQAGGRELNLFYLTDESRERIAFEHSTFNIQHTKLEFDVDAIKNELHLHPERFSPNVILRPVFQELVLPNIAFIGGGGEIAYWLELKKVFEAVNIPFPVLVLRNSFMLVSTEMNALAKKLQLGSAELFKSENELLNELMKRAAGIQLNLDGEKKQFIELYEKLKQISGKANTSLVQHTEALKTQAIKKISALEKKMLRAEKRRSGDQQRQLHKLKEQLFPQNTLQERIENFMPFYAKWGKDVIKIIYENTKGLGQEFCILEES